MKIVKLSIFLAVIAALSGLCLSSVNTMTAPVIEKQALEKELSALSELFPNAEFTSNQIDGEYVQSEYVCDDGVVYKASSYGFGGDIVFMIAIDNSGNYIGYVVNDCSQETSGIGSQVADQPFHDQILSKNVDTQIDTISGATFSSGAVQRAIDEAASFYKQR